MHMGVGKTLSALSIVSALSGSIPAVDRVDLRLLSAPTNPICYELKREINSRVFEALDASDPRGDF